MLRSIPTGIENSIKNSKKIQKIKKHYCGFFSIQNWLAKAEKGRKLKLSFRSVPTRPAIKNTIKIAKKLKKLKKTIMAFFQAKTGWQRPRKRETKNYRYDQLLPGPE